MNFANVIVDISAEALDRTFQYRIPKELEEFIRPGTPVEIPFGRYDSLRTGYVVEVTDKAAYDPARTKAIHRVQRDGSLAQEGLLLLAAWMKDTYGSTYAQALKTVLPVKKEPGKRSRPLVIEDYEPEELPLMNDEQQKAFAEICEEHDRDNPRPVLLQGVTGSGKTIIYMHLIRRMLEQGKQVIVLVPEIALTYQNVRRFYSCFGDKIAIVHSRLSAGERAWEFKKVREGRASVMIGPRSALFAPFPNLGLIIIDEEHENSYHSDMTPRFHARETAVQRGIIEGAGVLMGSATPSLEAARRCELGLYKRTVLTRRYMDRALPEVTTVDMGEEFRRGNRSVFSAALREALGECLQEKKQALLFLNRRGYAGFVSCRCCGYVVKCAHCDVSMTIHNNGQMVCHYCGSRRPLIRHCPQCGSEQIGGFKLGTQAMEELIRKEFPKARTLRMDLDTTRKKNGHEGILKAFSQGRADILIGTQMIAKGHDFPGVTLVGVLNADLSLYAGDYRSAERTFQLLCQVIGRAGRGEDPGRALIQTWHPEHFALVSAAKQDYEGFYREELQYRNLFGYPPSGNLLQIRCLGEDEERLDQAMTYLKQFIARALAHQPVVIMGPADDMVVKVNDQYRKVIYLKTADERILHWIREKVRQYVDMNSGFDGLLFQYDFNE